jgi:hypothetical protein
MFRGPQAFYKKANKLYNFLFFIIWQILCFTWLDVPDRMQLFPDPAVFQPSLVIQGIDS